MDKSNLYRKVQVNVRYTENEKKYIEEKAKYCNLSISEYCRKSSMSAVVIKRDTSQLIKILTELNRIGNNINQIAKVIHEQGNYISDENYVDIQDQFSEMKDIIIDRIFKATYEYEARLNEAIDRNVHSMEIYSSSLEEYEELFDAAELEEEEWEDYDEGAFV